MQIYTKSYHNKNGIQMSRRAYPSNTKVEGTNYHPKTLKKGFVSNCKEKKIYMISLSKPTLGGFNPYVKF